MHKKNKKKFIYVVIFTLIMAMVALPLIQYLPDSTQQYFKNVAINLGLDLQGGLHLEYALDLSKVPDDKQDDAKTAVQAVVERRVNAYGVGEPIVQLAHRGGETFLIVEFPGAKEMEDVKNAIQTTPFLIFKEEKTEEEINAEKEDMKNVTDPMNEKAISKAIASLERAKNGEDFGELAKEISQDPGNKDNGGVLDFAKKGSYVEEFDNVLFNDDFKDGEVWPELVETKFGWHIIKKLETKGEGEDKEIKAQHILLRKVDIPVEPYKDTELTGEFLDRADLSFGGRGNGGGISEPQVNLQFNSEGAKMFADITKRNLGKTVAIYLDDQVVSAPTVQAEIVDGNAVISGNFTTDEAKELSQRLNEGALPVPITLVSQQSVEATLGAEALEKGLKAGAVGLILVMIYMILYYRFFGFIAAVSLGIYAVTLIAIFKLSSLTPMSITLTLAGIAGLILSIGMAVDANVLIFERIREELILGKNFKRAVDQGFDRAWPSIRDGNVSTILTSMILMMMGTGFVKGFALILILGVLVSMFTAIVLVKIIVRFSSGEWLEKRMWLIMSPKKLNQDKK
jgi:protein-export membrane protein SecD